MIYFTSRKLAREFSAKSGKKVKDMGAEARKRWAVQVI